MEHKKTRKQYSPETKTEVYVSRESMRKNCKVEKNTVLYGHHGALLYSVHRGRRIATISRETDNAV